MKEITGNLLDPDHGFKAIGHGVNCHGLMGAGIAKAIADTYPDVLLPYQMHCSAGRLRPGGVWPVSIEDGPRIYNLASQDAPGANAKLDLLWASVSLALADCWRHGIDHLALPEIGCGIGGLEWNDGQDSFDRIGQGKFGSGREARYVQDVLWALDLASPVTIVVVHFG